MTSAIDPTKPTQGSALTMDVRENFQTAADEITALQAEVATLQAQVANGALPYDPDTVILQTYAIITNGSTALTTDKTDGLTDGATYAIFGPHLLVNAVVSYNGTTLTLGTAPTGINTPSNTAGVLITICNSTGIVTASGLAAGEGTA